jgi:hypothetical protein
MQLQGQQANHPDGEGLPWQELQVAAKGSDEKGEASDPEPIL